MNDGPLVWLVGALIVFVLVINVIIPAAITAAAGVNPIGSATDLWAGTAATPHTMAATPLGYLIVSVTTFGKGTASSNYNDTKLSANGTSTVVFSHTPIRTGEDWNAYNVTLTAQMRAAGAESYTNATASTALATPQTVILTRTPNNGTTQFTWEGQGFDTLYINLNGAYHANFTGNGSNTNSTTTVTGFITGLNNFTYYSIGTTVPVVTNNTTALTAGNGSPVFNMEFNALPNSTLNTIVVSAELEAGNQIEVFLNGTRWNGTGAIYYGLGNITSSPWNYTLNGFTLLSGNHNLTFISNGTQQNITSACLNYSYNTTTERPLNVSTIRMDMSFLGDGVKWLTGCGYANRTLSNGANSWTGMNTTCLSAGSYGISVVTNGTGNLTNATVTYQYYATNTDYSISTNTITPTATGYYTTTYTYGTSLTASTNSLLLLLPLLIAVVVLLLFLKSADVF